MLNGVQMYQINAWSFTKCAWRITICINRKTYLCTMILTDTHTHLYAKEFDPDRNAVIQRSIDAGVSRLFLPNIDSHSVSGMLELIKHYPQNCFPMAGIHPCSVHLNYEEQLKEVETGLSKKEMKFCAMGEIGLDFYRDITFASQQKVAFCKQLELALKHHLPVVLHVRKAFKETLEIVKEYNCPELKGIFHCFSGSPEEANQVLSLTGFYLGIGGVITFKNSGLQELVPQIPLEHIVLETDAPYLAPAPFRGKRNESVYITLIAQKLAELKNCTVEEVAEQTTKNSIAIFGV